MFHFKNEGRNSSAGLKAQHFPCGNFYELLQQLPQEFIELMNGMHCFLVMKKTKNSKIINYLDDSEHKRNYAIIETSLSNVLSKGAVMDLQFIRAIKVDGVWKTDCLNQYIL